jgi:NADH dehydrogenase
MAECEAIVSFVGTMRNRFAAGDTYESSDVASCEQLANAGRAAGVKRFLLLSSYGAGGAGAYLKMKARCEDIVKASGLAWVVFRPSALVSPKDGPKDVSSEGTHGKRSVPPGAGALFGVMGAIPGLGGFADDTKPIPIEIVCDGFLRALGGSYDGKTLTGRDLWGLAKGAA